MFPSLNLDLFYDITTMSSYFFNELSNIIKFFSNSNNNFNWKINQASLNLMNTFTVNNNSLNMNLPNLNDSSNSNYSSLYSSISADYFSNLLPQDQIFFLSFLNEKNNKNYNNYIVNSLISSLEPLVGVTSIDFFRVFDRILSSFFSRYFYDENFIIIIDIINKILKTKEYLLPDFYSMYEKETINKRNNIKSYIGSIKDSFMLIKSSNLPLLPTSDTQVVLPSSSLSFYGSAVSITRGVFGFFKTSPESFPTLFTAEHFRELILATLIKKYKNYLNTLLDYNNKMLKKVKDVTSNPLLISSFNLPPPFTSIIIFMNQLTNNCENIKNILDLNHFNEYILINDNNFLKLNKFYFIILYYYIKLKNNLNFWTNSLQVYQNIKLISNIGIKKLFLHNKSNYFFYCDNNSNELLLINLIFSTFLTNKLFVEDFKKIDYLYKFDDETFFEFIENKQDIRKEQNFNESHSIEVENCVQSNMIMFDQYLLENEILKKEIRNNLFHNTFYQDQIEYYNWNVNKNIIKHSIENYNNLIPYEFFLDLFQLIVQHLFSLDTFQMILLNVLKNNYISTTTSTTFQPQSSNHSSYSHEKTINHKKIINFFNEEFESIFVQDYKNDHPLSNFNSNLTSKLENYFKDQKTIVNQTINTDLSLSNSFLTSNWKSLCTDDNYSQIIGEKIWLINLNNIFKEKSFSKSKEFYLLLKLSSLLNNFYDYINYFMLNFYNSSFDLSQSPELSLFISEFLSQQKIVFSVKNDEILSSEEFLSSFSNLNGKIHFVSSFSEVNDDSFNILDENVPRFYKEYVDYSVFIEKIDDSKRQSQVKVNSLSNVANSSSLSSFLNISSSLIHFNLDNNNLLHITFNNFLSIFDLPSVNIDFYSPNSSLSSYILKIFSYALHCGLFSELSSIYGLEYHSLIEINSTNLTNYSNKLLLSSLILSTNFFDNLNSFYSNFKSEKYCYLQNFNNILLKIFNIMSKNSLNYLPLIIKIKPLESINLLLTNHLISFFYLFTNIGTYSSFNSLELANSSSYNELISSPISFLNYTLQNTILKTKKDEILENFPLFANIFPLILLDNSNNIGEILLNMLHPTILKGSDFNDEFFFIFFIGQLIESSLLLKNFLLYDPLHVNFNNIIDSYTNSSMPIDPSSPLESSSTASLSPSHSSFSSSPTNCSLESYTILSKFINSSSNYLNLKDLSFNFLTSVWQLFLILPSESTLKRWLPSFSHQLLNNKTNLIIQDHTFFTSFILSSLLVLPLPLTNDKGIGKNKKPLSTPFFSSIYEKISLLDNISSSSCSVEYFQWELNNVLQTSLESLELESLLLTAITDPSIIFNSNSTCNSPKNYSSTTSRVIIGANEFDLFYDLLLSYLLSNELLVYIYPELSNLWYKNTLVTKKIWNNISDLFKYDNFFSRDEKDLSKKDNVKEFNAEDPSKAFNTSHRTSFAFSMIKSDTISIEESHKFSKLWKDVIESLKKPCECLFLLLNNFLLQKLSSNTFDSSNSRGSDINTEDIHYIFQNFICQLVSILKTNENLIEDNKKNNNEEMNINTSSSLHLLDKSSDIDNEDEMKKIPINFFSTRLLKMKNFSTLSEAFNFTLVSLLMTTFYELLLNDEQSYLVFVFNIFLDLFFPINYHKFHQKNFEKHRLKFFSLFKIFFLSEISRVDNKLSSKFGLILKEKKKKKEEDENDEEKGLSNDSYEDDYERENSENEEKESEDEEYEDDDICFLSETTSVFLKQVIQFLSQYFTSLNSTSISQTFYFKHAPSSILCQETLNFSSLVSLIEKNIDDFADWVSDPTQTIYDLDIDSNKKQLNYLDKFLLILTLKPILLLDYMIDVILEIAFNFPSISTINSLSLSSSLNDSYSIKAYVYNLTYEKDFTYNSFTNDFSLSLPPESSSSNSTSFLYSTVPLYFNKNELGNLLSSSYVINLPHKSTCFPIKNLKKLIINRPTSEYVQERNFLGNFYSLLSTSKILNENIDENEKSNCVIHLAKLLLSPSDDIEHQSSDFNHFNRLIRSLSMPFLTEINQLNLQHKVYFELNDQIEIDEHSNLNRTEFSLYSLTPTISGVCDSIIIANWLKILINICIEYKRNYEDEFFNKIYDLLNLNDLFNIFVNLTNEATEVPQTNGFLNLASTSLKSVQSLPSTTSLSQASTYSNSSNYAQLKIIVSIYYRDSTYLNLDQIKFWKNYIKKKIIKIIDRSLFLFIINHLIILYYFYSSYLGIGNSSSLYRGKINLDNVEENISNSTSGFSFTTISSSFLLFNKLVSIFYTNLLSTFTSEVKNLVNDINTNILVKNNFSASNINFLTNYLQLLNKIQIDYLIDKIKKKFMSLNYLYNNINMLIYFNNNNMFNNYINKKFYSIIFYNVFTFMINPDENTYDNNDEEENQDNDDFIDEDTNNIFSPQAFTYVNSYEELLTLKKFKLKNVLNFLIKIYYNTSSISLLSAKHSNYTNYLYDLTYSNILMIQKKQLMMFNNSFIFNSVLINYHQKYLNNNLMKIKNKYYIHNIFDSNTANSSKFALSYFYDHSKDPLIYTLKNYAVLIKNYLLKNSTNHNHPYKLFSFSNELVSTLKISIDPFNIFSYLLPLSINKPNFDSYKYEKFTLFNSISFKSIMIKQIQSILILFSSNLPQFIDVFNPTYENIHNQHLLSEKDNNSIIAPVTTSTTNTSLFSKIFSDELMSSYTHRNSSFKMNKFRSVSASFLVTAANNSLAATSAALAVRSNATSQAVINQDLVTTNIQPSAPLNQPNNAFPSNRRRVAQKILIKFQSNEFDYLWAFLLSEIEFFNKNLLESINYFNTIKNWNLLDWKNYFLMFLYQKSFISKNIKRRKNNLSEDYENFNFISIDTNYENEVNLMLNDLLIKLSNGYVPIIWTNNINSLFYSNNFLNYFSSSTSATFFSFSNNIVSSFSSSSSSIFYYNLDYIKLENYLVFLRNRKNQLNNWFLSAHLLPSNVYISYFFNTQLFFYLLKQTFSSKTETSVDKVFLHYIPYNFSSNLASSILNNNNNSTNVTSYTPTFPTSASHDANNLLKSLGCYIILSDIKLYNSYYSLNSKFTEFLPSYHATPFGNEISLLVYCSNEEQDLPEESLKLPLYITPSPVCPSFSPPIIPSDEPLCVVPFNTTEDLQDWSSLRPCMFTGPYYSLPI